LNGSNERKARPASGIRRRRAAIDPRTAKREKAADRWLEWFHRAMREAVTKDPAALLPDMAAKLEELIADKIAAELAPAQRRIRELERAKSTSITAWSLIANASKRFHSWRTNQHVEASK
jgi:hypothetical protein